MYDLQEQAAVQQTYRSSMYEVNRDLAAVRCHQLNQHLGEVCFRLVLIVHL